MHPALVILGAVVVCATVVLINEHRKDKRFFTKDLERQYHKAIANHIREITKDMKSIEKHLSIKEAEPGVVYCSACTPVKGKHEERCLFKLPTRSGEQFGVVRQLR